MSLKDSKVVVGKWDILIEIMELKSLIMQDGSYEGRR